MASFYLYYRLVFDFSDIIYYSPEIITEEDLVEIDKSFVIDLINQYLEDNDLPEEIIL